MIVTLELYEGNSALPLHNCRFMLPIPWVFRGHVRLREGQLHRTGFSHNIEDYFSKYTTNFDPRRLQ